MTTIRVMNERCENCLFTPKRIVDGQRMRDIIERCRRTETHFTCHLGTLADHQDVWCAGWWETQEGEDIVTAATAMGLVERVTPEQVANAPAYLRREHDDG